MARSKKHARRHGTPAHAVDTVSSSSSSSSSSSVAAATMTAAVTEMLETLPMDNTATAAALDEAYASATLLSSSTIADVDMNSPAAVATTSSDAVATVAEADPVPAPEPAPAPQPAVTTTCGPTSPLCSTTTEQTTEPVLRPATPPTMTPQPPSQTGLRPPQPVLQTPYSPRRLSLDAVRFETKTWAQTHPINPIFPLFKQLLWILLQNGVQWYFRMVRLLLFVVLLLPGFIQVFLYYFTSSDIVRNVRYGPEARNFLDIYLPINYPLQQISSRRPVLVFWSGGIWTIGYKAWGAFFGHILASHGIVVVMPDYRNFPQGRVQHMLEDVDAALVWVTNNIDRYGGDPDQIHVMGQSAGAHLAVMTLLFKAREEAETEARAAGELNLPVSTNPHFCLCHRRLGPGARVYKLSQIKTLFGISGPYDLVGLTKHFHDKGLHMPMLAAIMGGKEYLPYLSPTRLVSTDPAYRSVDVVKRFPAIVLLHGKADECVPYTTALEFGRALQKAGYHVQVKLYEGKTHTDPIIEDLLYAEELVQDDLMADIALTVAHQHHHFECTQQTPQPAADSDILVREHTSPTKKERLSFAATYSPIAGDKDDVQTPLVSPRVGLFPMMATSPKDTASAATGTSFDKLGNWAAGLLVNLQDRHQRIPRHTRSIVPKFLVDLARLVNPF